jgi:hypothetical protein
MELARPDPFKRKNTKILTIAGHELECFTVQFKEKFILWCFGNWSGLSHPAPKQHNKLGITAAVTNNNQQQQKK